MTSSAANNVNERSLPCDALSIARLVFTFRRVLSPQQRAPAIVRSVEHGTSFVSRSEAKRLLHGLFAGIDAVGQGFADEVFRVWAKAHPDTKLMPVDMIEPVAFMVRRTLAEA